MPPYREVEDMCTKSKQIVSPIDADTQAAIDVAIDISNNTNNQQINSGVSNNSTTNDSSSHLNNRRSSPSTRRRRGRDNSQSSASSPSSPKHGRRGHITNINRINVINNYPYHANNNTKENIGWFTLRIVIAILILIWFGAMISVLKNSPSSPTSDNQSAQSKAAMSFGLLKYFQIGKGSGGGVRGGIDMAVQDGTATTNNNQQQPSPQEQGTPIWELSLFGNKSPKDFQLSTPHAPSCSKLLNAQGVSYTLVSQLSNDRLWMVPYHCKRWGANPMSIAVFTDTSSVIVKADLVKMGCFEDQLTVQTVKKTKYDPTGKEYPVNLLRNLAFSAVKTSHITYADVDFWPASDLHSILSDDNIKERLASDSKLATVIPVFQMNRRCKEYKDCRAMNIPSMPKNKMELINLIKKKGASTFDPTNVGGHGSTKYITWRDQEPRTFVDLPCIKSNRYEPYLTVRYCSDLPPFQEGFTGYGKNKMTVSSLHTYCHIGVLLFRIKNSSCCHHFSCCYHIQWIMQLRRAGYLFTQLGGAFLIHYPHLDSKSRLEWNKKPKAMEKYHKSASELLENEDQDIDWGSFKRARVDALFLDFKEWLDGTVENEPRVPMCGDALNDDVRLWVHPDKSDDTIEEEDADDEQQQNGEEEAEDEVLDENAADDGGENVVIDEDADKGNGNIVQSIE